MKYNIKKKLIIMIVLSLISAFFVEGIVFQFYSLKGGNKDVLLSNYKLNNIEKNGKYYVTKSAENSIEFNYDGYINELAFDYISNNDFTWKVKIIDNDKNQNEYSFNSAAIINKANKIVRYDSKKVKITIYGEQIKFKNITVHNKIEFNFIRFILLFILIMSFLYLVFYSKNIKQNIQKLFLLISLSVGSIYIISTPISVYTSNDDQVHFHNMYTLLDGKKTTWTYASRYYDKLIIDSPKRFTTYEENKAYVKFLLENDNKKSRVSKVNNRVFGIPYNQIVYIPNALVMKLCKIVHIPFVFTILMGKFVNLLMYSILIYFAIKIIPTGKKLVFAIGLLPSSMSLACQFSYDPTIIASCILATSFLIKMYYDDQIRYNDLFIYIILIIWASLVKAVYCPLLLLPVFILNNKTKNKKIINICLVLIFLVLMSSFVLPTVLSANVSGDSRVSGTSVTLQLKYIIHNPIRYTKIIIMYTIKYLFEFIIGKSTIYDMGYIVRGENSFLNFSYSLLMINLLYLSFSEGNGKYKINNTIKILNLIILCAIWILVATSLYLSWTPVGLQEIQGVQGRYFLPTLLLTLFLIKPSSKYEIKNNFMIIFIPILIISLNVLYVLCKFYW